MSSNMCIRFLLDTSIRQNFLRLLNHQPVSHFYVDFLHDKDSELETEFIFIHSLTMSSGELLNFTLNLYFLSCKMGILHLSCCEDHR